jgi:hypothetical protein
MMKAKLILGLVLLLGYHQVVKAQVITNSANIKLTAGSNLILNATGLENNNIIDAADNSNIILKGTQSIKISGSENISFGTVNLNNGQGVILFNPMTVKKEMIFQDCILSTKNSSYILFDNGATSTAQSDSSFVRGTVKRIGVGSFVFNVGDSGTTRPLTLGNLSNSDTISVNYFKTNPANAGFNPGLMGDSLQVVSQCEYWSVGGSTAQNSTVSLSWDNVQSCGVGDPGDLRIATWDGAAWQNEGSANLTGDATTGELTTSAALPLSGNTVFTLASISQSNPLPIELGYFMASMKSENTACIDWATMSETNSDLFIIEKSSDGINYFELDRLNAAGMSNKKIEYSTFDYNVSKLNYYSLYLLNTNGVKEFVADALLVKANTSQTKVKIGNNFVEIPQSNTGGKLRLIIYDLKGTIMMDQTLEVGANTDFLEIMPPANLNGIFIGNLNFNNHEISQKLQFFD